MNHLTPLQVIVCHDENVRRYGGLPGIVDPAKVEVLIERVRNYESYEGLSDVFAFAAMYCVAIARGYAFLDGNKRTAINCTYAFLKRNGVRTFVPKDLEEKVIKVAVGEMTAAGFADYLRSAFSEVASR